MNKTQKAILSTLIYSSLFSTSLSFHELFTKLHTNSPIYLSDFKKNLKELIKAKKIYSKDNLYNLTNHFENKKEQIKIFHSKKKFLKKYLPQITSISCIKAVFLTGSLSALNSKEKDDIDLMIITSSKRLWLTRFLLNFKLNKFRRHPRDKSFSNKLCFNIFIEEDNLEFDQNIYIANELIQAQPLFLKGNIYQKFINKNLWLKKYLANSISNSLENNLLKFLKKDYSLNLIPQKVKDNTQKSLILDYLNHLLFFLQYLYMKPRITSEIINLKKAFFHPRNLSCSIPKLFQARKNSQNLLK